MHFLDSAENENIFYFPSPRSFTFLRGIQENTFQLNYELLKKVHMDLRISKVFTNKKVLVTVMDDINEAMNASVDGRLFKLLEKFDGFYFPWLDNFEQSNALRRIPKVEKMAYLSNALISLRNTFKNKIIVATAGMKPTRDGFFDFKVFIETVDFVAIYVEERLMHVHMPNYFPVVAQPHSADKTTLVKFTSFSPSPYRGCPGMKNLGRHEYPKLRTAQLGT